MLLSALFLAATAFDPAAYHQQHCTQCHDEQVYTRPDRRIHSLDQLESQIRRCDAALNKQLFDEDMMQLRDYLNQYYQFDE